MLKLISTLNGHDDKVWCVAWNPQGTLLASCSGDKTVRIWSQEKSSSSAGGDETSSKLVSEHGKWSCVATLNDGHSRTIRWISWSPCGRKLASASFDSSIIIWKQKDASSFEVLAHLEGHENEVKCTAWSYDGAFLASCSRDRSVWIWDVSDEDDFECNSVLTMHDQDVKHVLWHPHKNHVVSSSYDNTIKFSAQDGDDWSCIATLNSHSSTVWSCDFDVDGEKLVSCSDDKTLKIWKELDEADPKVINKGQQPNWKCICTVTGYHARTIFSVKWSKVDRDLIATACADNSIHIFQEDKTPQDSVAMVSEGESGQLTSLKLLHQQKSAHSQDCNCVDWHPKQSGILASCGDDGSVKIWSFAKQTD